VECATLPHHTPSALWTLVLAWGVAGALAYRLGEWMDTQMDG
jgi:hypothetical protein